MNDHDIEKCTEDCFDEKEGIAIPAKAMIGPDERAREIMANRRWLFIDDGEELTGQIAAHLRAYGEEEFKRGREFEHKQEHPLNAKCCDACLDTGFRRGVEKNKLALEVCDCLAHSMTDDPDKVHMGTDIVMTGALCKAWKAFQRGLEGESVKCNCACEGCMEHDANWNPTQAGGVV